MNRNILALALAFAVIAMLNRAGAAPIWTEIGSSGTLDSSAENVGADDNLATMFGAAWGPYGHDEWARYS